LLLTAMRSVLHNAVWFSQGIFQLFVRNTLPSPAQILWQTFTPLEQQVVLGIGEGLTNKQIAQKLSRSVQTVRNYSSQLYQKLGLNVRSEIVVWLYQHHIEGFVPKATLPPQRIISINRF
jgi:DNA-binding NarL/FixJ family response regulator